MPLCYGMVKTDLRAVEHVVTRVFPRRSVKDVTHKRRAYVSHVYPYLVCAPRFRPQADERHSAAHFERLVVCNGTFTFVFSRSFSAGAKRFSGVGTVDGSFDGAAARQDAVAKGYVCLFYITGKQRSTI